MTIEEIRKNAPEGATHYRDETRTGVVIYYKHVLGKSLMFWLNTRWAYTDNTVASKRVKPL